MTAEEMALLTSKARKAHLSKGCLVRHAVAEITVKEAPPADVPMLIFEVRRVGQHLNQLLRLANTKGWTDIPQLRQALEQNREVEKLVVSAYTSPES